MTTERQPFPEFRSGDEPADVVDGPWKLFVGDHKLRDKIARAGDVKGRPVTLPEAMGIVGEHEKRMKKTLAIREEDFSEGMTLQELLDSYGEETSDG